MISTEELQKLADVFDNDFTKVRATMPTDLKLSEIVGVGHRQDKTSRVTYRKGLMLYIAWVKTSECERALLGAKEEIKARDDWHERWEPWEIYGSLEPYALRSRLLKSRLRNAQERAEFSRFYGERSSQPEATA